MYIRNITEKFKEEGISCLPTRNSLSFVDFCNDKEGFLTDYDFIDSSFLKAFYSENKSTEKQILFFEKIYEFYQPDAWVINFSYEKWHVENDMKMLSFIDFLIDNKNVEPKSILIVGDSTARFSKDDVLIKVNKKVDLNNIYLATSRNYKKEGLFRKTISLLNN